MDEVPLIVPSDGELGAPKYVPIAEKAMQDAVGEGTTLAAWVKHYQLLGVEMLNVGQAQGYTLPQIVFSIMRFGIGIGILHDKHGWPITVGDSIKEKM